jgi:hypothetical protein
MGAINYVNQVILVEEIGPVSEAPTPSPTVSAGGTPDLPFDGAVKTVSAPAGTETSLRHSNRNSDAEPLQFSNIDLDAFESEMKEVTSRPWRNHRHGGKL